MKCLKKLTFTEAGYGLTILRIILGIVFMAHGSQKLFGLFGGYGLEGTGKFMESLGLTPGYLMALLAGSGEFFGGLLVLLGLFSRIGAFLTMIVSVVAFFSVHISHGFFMSNGGFEYILVLLVASIAIMIEGGAKYSIDNLLFKRFK